MGTGMPFSEEELSTQRAIEGQSGVIRDLLVEQRETNRLLRKLAGEPEDRGPSERTAEQKTTQAREAAQAQASHTREVSEQQAAQARVQKTERWRQKAERRQEALRRRLTGSRLGLTQRGDSPRSRKRPG